MKVLHLIPSLEIGGAEKQLATLVLATRGELENRVCTILRDGHYSEELRAQGIAVTCLNAGPFKLIGALLKLRREIKEYKPDILVTHLIHADLIGRVFGRLFGVRCVICSQRGSLQSWEFLRFFDRLTTWLVTHYLVQTEVSKQAIAKALRTSPERFSVIPNILDVARIENASQERGMATRQSLNIPEDAYVVSCIGNLRPVKGVETLVRAATKTQNEHLHILLVGEGPSRELLEKLAKELGVSQFVHFLGSRKDALDILSASNLMVLPSLEEGMSNAILEAMALSVPILVSDIPVNAELTERGEYGALFKVGDFESLAQELSIMYSNQARNREVAEKAKRHVYSLCEETSVVKRFVEVLHEQSKKGKR